MRPEDADGSRAGTPSPQGHGELLTLRLNSDGTVAECAPRARGRPLDLLRHAVDRAHLAVELLGRGRRALRGLAAHRRCRASAGCAAPRAGRAGARAPAVARGATRTRSRARATSRRTGPTARHWTHRQRVAHALFRHGAVRGRGTSARPRRGPDPALRGHARGRGAGAGAAAAAAAAPARRARRHVQLEKGLGPRHLVFHPTLRVAYVINELRSSVSVLKYQPRAGEAPRAAAAAAAHAAAAGGARAARPPPRRSSTRCTTRATLATSRRSRRSRPAPSAATTTRATRARSACTRQTAGSTCEPRPRLDRRVRGRVRGRAVARGRLVDSVAAGAAATARSRACRSAARSARSRAFNFDATGRWLVVGNQTTTSCAVRDRARRPAAPTAHAPTRVLSPNYIGAMPAAALDDAAAAEAGRRRGSVARDRLGVAGACVGFAAMRAL